MFTVTVGHTFRECHHADLECGLKPQMLNYNIAFSFEGAYESTYCLAAKTCSCLANKQLDTFLGPHVKGNDCAVLS